VVSAAWRKAGRFAVTAIVTAVLLAVLVRGFGTAAGFVAAARSARPSWVAASFAAAVMCTFLTTVRWQLVVSAMGYRLPFRRALEVVLATWPLAVVTPSRANDLLRPLAVRDLVPLTAGAGGVVAEKAVDLGLLLALAAVGAACNALWAWTGVITLVLMLEVFVVVMVVTRRQALARLPLLRRRPQTVDELFEALSAMGRAPAKLASIASVSLLIRFFTVVVSHTLLVAVGADIPFVQTLTLWPAAMLVGVAPLTLGGMGTRDAAFLALLAERGTHVDPSSILVATVGYSAVAIWSFALLGLPWMIREALTVRSSKREQ
jgi:glycosyltransferase 2 family protein